MPRTFTIRIVESKGGRVRGECHSGTEEEMATATINEREVAAIIWPILEEVLEHGIPQLKTIGVGHADHSKGETSEDATRRAILEADIYEANLPREGGTEDGGH